MEREAKERFDGEATTEVFLYRDGKRGSMERGTEMIEREAVERSHVRGKL